MYIGPASSSPRRSLKVCSDVQHSSLVSTLRWCHVRTLYAFKWHRAWSARRAWPSVPVKKLEFISTISLAGRVLRPRRAQRHQLRGVLALCRCSSRATGARRAM
jgi:hypothetical protein